jgi:hypothetical protein
MPKLCKAGQQLREQFDDSYPGLFHIPMMAKLMYGMKQHLVGSK